MNVRQIIESALAPLRARVLGIIRRAVVHAINDGSGAQTVRVERLAGELSSDRVEVLWPYGYTAKPAAGSEAVVLAVGGDASHLVCLPPFERSARPTGLADGDAVLYHREGHRVTAKAGGIVEIASGATAQDVVIESGPSGLRVLQGGSPVLEVNPAGVTITGTLTVSGALTCGSLSSLGASSSIGIMEAANFQLTGGVSPYATHTHSGVQAGPSNTGPPN